MKRNLFKYLIASLVLVAGSANALQVIDVKDGQTVAVKASLSQLTRIGMTDGSQLAGVWGVKGQVKITKDDEAGEAFIQPMTNSPFSVFVRDEYGSTYSLMVQPVRSPGEMILLRPARKTGGSEQAEKNLPYVERIKRMWKIIANDDQGDVISTTDTEHQKTIPFWKEATLRLEQTRQSATLSADIYTLINVSDKDMTIVEDELKDLNEDWRLISIRNPVLKPGDSTRIYIIRDR